MKSNIVREIAVADKKVYIVDNHHEVLFPWSEYVSKNEVTPVLLTFDHHMDTLSGFYRYTRNLAAADWKALSEKMIAAVDLNEPNSIVEAVEKLRNNEHIAFAIQTGIISDAVIFSLMNAGICKDYNNSKIYYIDPDCISKCRKSIHDDECQIKVYDNVIESEELLFKLTQINKFIPGFFVYERIEMKYILDIDLDSFNTKKAINPTDISVFNYLIKNAEIITIATEENYVELEKKDQDINTDYLLEKVLGYIREAIK